MINKYNMLPFNDFYNKVNLKVEKVTINLYKNTIIN